MKRPLKLCELAPVLAGAFLGLASCDRANSGKSQDRLSERLSQLEPSSLRTTVFGAMCYTPACPADQKSASWSCPACRATTMYEEVSDLTVYSYLQADRRRFGDTLAKLNRCGKPWNLEFAYDESALCEACFPGIWSEERLLLATRFLDQPERAVVKTPMSRVQVGALEKFLSAKSVDELKGDEYGKGSPSSLLSREELNSIRTVLGLPASKPD